MSRWSLSLFRPVGHVQMSHLFYNFGKGGINVLQKLLCLHELLKEGAVFFVCASISLHINLSFFPFIRCSHNLIYKKSMWHMCSSNKTSLCLIRHIAITICPFMFAFSHLPRCGQLLQQKHRNNLTWNFLCKFFLHFHISASQANPYP